MNTQNGHSDLARAQALNLLALSIEDDQDGYIFQMRNIAEPYLVIHRLVELLYLGTPDYEREHLAQAIHDELADML